MEMPSSSPVLDSNSLPADQGLCIFLNIYKNAIFYVFHFS